MLKQISIGAAVIAVAAGVAWYVLQPKASNEPAFVGLQIQGVNADIAMALGQSNVYGVLVRDVALGGPSDRAGFQRGDLIVRFADQTIDNFETMLRLVGAAKANASIPVRILRRGEEITLTLKAGGWTEAWKVEKTSAAALPQLGLTFLGLTQDVRTQFNLPWGSLGVVVAKIDADVAKGVDLSVGEVVMQVNQLSIWTPEQLQKEYAEAKRSGRLNLLLLVQGINGFRFVLLPVR